MPTATKPQTLTSTQLKALARKKVHQERLARQESLCKELLDLGAQRASSGTWTDLSPQRDQVMADLIRDMDFYNEFACPHPLFDNYDQPGILESFMALLSHSRSADLYNAMSYHGFFKANPGFAHQFWSSLLEHDILWFNALSRDLEGTRTVSIFPEELHFNALRLALGSDYDNVQTARNITRRFVSAPSVRNLHRQPVSVAIQIAQLKASKPNYSYGLLSILRSDLLPSQELLEVALNPKVVRYWNKRFASELLSRPDLDTKAKQQVLSAYPNVGLTWAIGPENTSYASTFPWDESQVLIFLKELKDEETWSVAARELCEFDWRSRKDAWLKKQLLLHIPFPVLKEAQDNFIASEDDYFIARMKSLMRVYKKLVSEQVITPLVSELEAQRTKKEIIDLTWQILASSSCPITQLNPVLKKMLS